MIKMSKFTKYQEWKVIYYFFCFILKEISILQFLPPEIQYMKTLYQGQGRKRTEQTVQIQTQW